MSRALFALTAFIFGSVLLLGTTGSSLAQEEFLKGKAMRIVVATAPGGGFNTYARVIARHLGAKVPGNPAVVVENMPGAGHLIGANHVYKVAKADGLTIGNFNGSLLLNQVLGRPGIEFDARKFIYVGAPSRDAPVCALHARTGIKDLRQWLAAKDPVKIGAIGPGDSTYENPKILQAALGLPMNIVSGYKGTAPIRLAVEAGEVDGLCLDWTSLKATWHKALTADEVAVVLQILPTPHPELPKVPAAINFAKDEDGRRFVQVIHDRGSIFRTYVLPPGVPKDRVETIRRAFAATLRDAEFLAEAEKSKLTIDPVSGEELTKAVQGLFELDPAFIAKLKDVLK